MSLKETNNSCVKFIQCKKLYPNPSEDNFVTSFLRSSGGKARQGSTGGQPLDVHAIGSQAAHSLELVVVFLNKLGETKLGGHVDLLAAGEFELGTTEGLHGNVALVLTATHGQEDLTDVATGGLTVSLTEGTTHTSLQPIGAGARKHLVHTQDVERVGAHTQVKVLTTTVGGEVLVARNAGGFQGLGRDLLVLVGHHVHGTGEHVSGAPLHTVVVDTDLRVRDTTAKPTLGVRFVLAVTVALIRTTTHLDEVLLVY